MSAVSRHCARLRRTCVDAMRAMYHTSTEVPLCIIHDGCPLEVFDGDDDGDAAASFGPVVNFSLQDAQGAPIGYASVARTAQGHGIHLRTGCFCNPGACHYALGLTGAQVEAQLDAGHVCWDDTDVVQVKDTSGGAREWKAQATGSIRVSFGYMSTRDDVDTWVAFLRDCYLANEQSLSSLSSSCVAGSAPSTSITIQQLCVYPVKSCAAVSVDHWPIDATGLRYDRHWMVVAGDGRALTQKTLPLLALVQPHIDTDHQQLTLTFNGRSDYGSVSVPLNGPPPHPSHSTDSHAVVQEGRLNAKVCGDGISVLDCGAAVAQWLTRVLDTVDCRLVRTSVDRNSSRLCKRTEYHSQQQQQ